ncbi:MAG: hypothetical protein JST84_32700 [Acidobacteria bacterium]|nr:hypothetical protein [Acidobacteriota bacterium]
MKIKALVQFVYGLFGALFLVAGLSVLSLRTNLLPAAVQNIIVHEAQGSLQALHLLQEFSALLVFAGLMSLWASAHYEQSKTYHWAMTTFWGLLAVAHWFDVRGPFQSVLGPLINTVPFVLFGLLGVLRIAAARKANNEVYR